MRSRAFFCETVGITTTNLFIIFKRMIVAFNVTSLHCFEANSLSKYRVTQKNGNFLKTQQKLKKSKKKNLLTEIEPLQLAF